MKLDRIIKIEKSLSVQVAYIFEKALKEFPSCTQLYDTFTRRIKDTEEYKKLPRYSQTYIQGWIDAHLQLIWRNYVVWVCSYEKIVMYATDSDSTYKAIGPDLIAKEGFFYFAWKEDITKPFTEPKKRAC